jgi:hypothetical protein
VVPVGEAGREIAAIGLTRNIARQYGKDGIRAKKF